jgi:hypothetical protein
MVHYKRRFIALVLVVAVCRLIIGQTIDDLAEVKEHYESSISHCCRQIRCADYISRGSGVS